MKLLCEYISDLLVEGGHGVFADVGDWGIYINHEPTNPKKCISIYDTSRQNPTYTYNQNTEPIENMSYQLRVRGLTYQEALDKIDVLSKFLEKRPRKIVDNYKYSVMFRTGALMYLGSLEDSTFIWTTNFKLIRSKE